MTLKTDLEHTIANLTGLEDAARTLKNQNFADIVLSARGRLSQLTEHPDIDTVQRHLSGELEQGGGDRLKELLDRAHDSLKEAREAVEQERHAQNAEQPPKAEPNAEHLKEPFPSVNKPQKAEPDKSHDFESPPPHSASGLPNGLLHRNAVGRLFQIHDGTWIPAEAETRSPLNLTAAGSGPPRSEG
jgi:hypothetical protein